MIGRTARLTLIFASMLVGFSFVFAQSKARDRRIIRFARNLDVSRLDHRLRRQSFETWLKSVVGRRASINWEVDDCGEQDGNPSNPINLNPPLCANARAKMADGNELGIAIAVGSHKKGIGGEPAIFYTYWDHHNLPGKLLELAAFVRHAKKQTTTKNSNR